MLFATPSGEAHEFGILMCSLLAAEQQYNCYYLGPNLPVADMLAAARKLNVEIIVLSLVQSPPDDETIADLYRLAETVSEDNIELWLGGKGAEYRSVQQPIRPENCATVIDLDDFYAKARQRRYVGKS
jgi:methanogenic corrinoid protein MtbC1